MQYLKELRKIERNENYAQSVGELRLRVHERVNEVLAEPGRSKQKLRDQVKGIVVDELGQGGLRPELEWYAEGFARGLFHDGSAYYRSDLPPEIQPKAEKHNHLGYSAGMVLRRR